jgi:two-component system LytT family sensor kinase
MRRTAGLLRQNMARQWCTCARMLPMAGDDALRFPSFWRLQIIGGICLYVVVPVACIPDIVKRPAELGEISVLVLFMFLGSFVLHPLCRSLLRRSPSWLAFGLRMSVWSLVVGIAAAVTAKLVLFHFDKVEWPDLAGDSVQSAVVLFLWCSLYFSIKQWQRSAQERERLLRAESAVREARLSALRYQLNPHFLFNSLNAASTLMLEGDAPAATRMLAQIGELLRTTLDDNASRETRLSQELAFMEQYLAIEQTRLGKRLHVEILVSRDTLDAIVPAMLLQPLVENAVRHGVAPVVEGGTIRIESQRNADRLLIAIGNSGPRHEAASSSASNGAGFGANGKCGGIGLRNTEERLETLYGDDHRFLLEWPEAGGCVVTIDMPFRRTAEAVEGGVCARADC